MNAGPASSSTEPRFRAPQTSQEVVKGPESNAGFLRLLLRWLPALVTLVGVCLLYVYIAHPPGSNFELGAKQTDYYTLLQRGFLKGHLYLDERPSDFIKMLPDPWDPANRPPGTYLHDASYYKGRYYLYFGTTPLLTLMTPFRLLTGQEMPIPLAMLLFALAAFLTGSALILSIRARHFPQIGPWITSAALLAFGTASFLPVLLGRMAFWELPILTAAFYLLLTLLCLFHSLHSARHARLWYAATGLCMGLTVASRFTYVLAAPFVFLPLLYWWFGRDKEGRGRSSGKTAGEIFRLALSVSIPLGLIALAMVWYNLARFGKPTEFGQSYQLTSLFNLSKTRFFGADYAKFNSYCYFLSPAQYTGNFPFISAHPNPIPSPVGYGGAEQAYGVLPNLPVCLFVLATPLLLLPRFSPEFASLRVSTLHTAAVAALMGVFMTCYFSAIGRYQADFLPSLVILALVGAFVLIRWIQECAPGLPALTTRLAFIFAVLASLPLPVFLPLSLYGQFKSRSPAHYEAVSSYLSRLHLGFPKVELSADKPAAFELELPENPPAGRQPLLIVRDDKDWTRVDLVVDEQGHLRLASSDSTGNLRLGRELSQSSPADKAKSVRHVLGFALNKVSGRSFIQAAWDEQPVLSAPWIHTGPTRQSLGFDPQADQGAPYFTGRIPRALPHPAGIDPSAIRWTNFTKLEFRLPAKGQGREVLASDAGNPAAWVLYLEYQDNGQAQLVLVDANSVLKAPQILVPEENTTHTLYLQYSGAPGQESVFEIRLDDDEVFHTTPQDLSEQNRFRLLGSELGNPFSGALAVNASSTDSILETPAFPQRLSLFLTFPRGKDGEKEPLLSSGSYYHGNVVCVKYEGTRRVSFGYEHFGIDPQYGEAITLGDGGVHEVEIEAPVFHSAAKGPDQSTAQLIIRVDGHEVLNREVPFYTADPRSLRIGQNRLGSTTCSEDFSGRLLMQRRN